MRLGTLGLAVAAAAALAAPGAAHGQVAVPEPTLPDFKALLLADAKVVAPVKAALRAGSAYAQPAAFGDLTADGTSDAVVLVTTPGAAGAVALYVLSGDGVEGGALRVVHRSQALYRATVKVVNGALVVLTPQYARGDDVCCPAVRLQRTYVWDRRARLLRRTDSRRLPRTAA